MTLSFTAKKRIRKSYGVITETVLMPNLIEVQRSSYEQFLQMHTSPDKRDPDGLESVFKSVFPIKDFSDRATLEYISFEFEAPAMVVTAPAVAPLRAMRRIRLLPESAT